MSASGRSSDASKKLLILLLSLLVITALFTVVVMLSLTSGGSPGERQGNASAAENASMAPTGLPRHDQNSVNSTTINGITRTSLVEALELLRSANDSAAWLSGNQDWRLFTAQTDYMDGMGLARHWSLILRSANGSLVAYVDNGTAIVLDADNGTQADTRPLAGQILRDSTELLSNVTNALGIDVDTSLTPFKLLFNDDGEDGVYQLSYHNPADESTSFVAFYNARTGEAIEG